MHDVYSQLENKVFTWWAFSSTTTQLKLAKAFLNGSESTLFTIDAIGVDIAAFSSFPGEQEILLLPGTLLTVESGVVADAGYWSYELSVWRAAQQRHHDDQHEDNDQDECNDDRSAKVDKCEDKSPDVMSASKNHNCVSTFQNIDLPHPGWEAILFGEDVIPSPSSPH